MNIALIIAGGSGQRMGMSVPKQFLTIYDKPILIYTLESFQKHDEIDAIEVVCVKGWADVLRAYAKQFGIDKLEWIVDGGNTGQESIRNGLNNLEKVCGPEDIVIIHDGIRPLVDSSVLSDVIEKAKVHGNGVTSLPYNEQIFVSTDGQTTTQYIPRDTLRRVSTPQAYQYKIIHEAYEYGFENQVGIGTSTYANTLMVELGHTLYFAKGSEKNIKITTKEDLQIFKAFIRSEE